MTQDTISALDRSILEFAQVPGNAALIPKTRSFCTPFRGKLFGQSALANVQAEISRCSAAVLVMGANPGTPNEGDTKFRSLNDHIATGLYGEVYWDSIGNVRPGWEPTTHWQWNQQIYDPLRAARVPLELVAFANYVPWGSPRKVSGLAAALDAALLRRVVHLADDIFVRALKILRPQLVIVPASISDGLPCGVIAHNRLAAEQGRLPYRTADGSAGNINYRLGQLQIDGLSTWLLHVRHATSFHFLSTEGREVLRNWLTAEIRRLVHV